LDVPAGTLNVHITVCISHLPPVEFKNHYRRQRIKGGVDAVIDLSALASSLSLNEA